MLIYVKSQQTLLSEQNVNSDFLANVLDKTATTAITILGPNVRMTLEWLDVDHSGFFV